MTLRSRTLVPLTLIPVLVLVGCGGSTTASNTDGKPSSKAATTAAIRTGDAHVIVPSGLQDDGDWIEVSSSTVLLRGTATPADAELAINDDVVSIVNGKWAKRVPLDVGRNTVKVGTAVDGNETSTTFVVTRKQTAAERAAARVRAEKAAVRLRAQLARERAEAAAARAAKEANFKSSAVAIPYNQLLKDPDSYSGKHVAYSGEIFQIQQSGDSGFMLVSTTCDDYDFCSDEIYVKYSGVRVRGAKGDKVTLYGTAKGGYEYDTQGGGTNYVPQVNAKYIDG
jgi:hypothetical protein